MQTSRPHTPSPGPRPGRLYGSSVIENGLQLAVTREMVKDAPSVDSVGPTSATRRTRPCTRYYDGHLGDDAQATSGQGGYAEGT